jgi:hypothetical protein
VHTIDRISFGGVSNLILMIYVFVFVLNIFLYYKFSVTDTGGAFRQVTSIFWDKIHECGLYFTNGIIENTTESYTLGRMLFWTILHCGLWPQWLHKLHIQNFINEKIDVVNVLKTTNPIIYRLYRQLTHNNIGVNKSLNEYLNNREIDVSII